ncbi:hypothetical protein BT67DRAFT_437594 [Trichocladium antarcticum]|uniref:Uncharacterized protein n=1 Tax=Trichocladium antarcticum TaxID=1450529 RepID=A0AAN6UST6_9PEZI|nr:hypothetical protein BT67DRAFT_437594 [Trichocladium antarcticum]
MRRFHLIWPTFNAAFCATTDKVNGLRPGAHLAEPAMFPSKPHQDRQGGGQICQTGLPAHRPTRGGLLQPQHDGGGASEVSSRVSASVMCMQMVGLFSPGLLD